jgi:cation diffusion facilitator family transporter
LLPQFIHRVLSQSSRISPIQYQSIAIGIGIFLTLLKFFAWGLTNSNAILTDALENIINVVAGAIGWYSLWLSGRPRDRNHPYGHGKIEFVSTGFEGGLIFLAGLLIIGKAVYGLFRPTHIDRLEEGIGLVLVSGLINFLTGWWLLKVGKKKNTLVLQSEGRHLLSDAYSSAGLLLGLLIVIWTDILWLDHVIAILFGGIILFTGFKLLRTAFAGIMDEADYELIGEMVKELEKKRDPNWIDVHNFRVIKYGNSYHIDCHLTLPWYFDLFQGHDEVTRFEDLLRKHDPSVSDFFIHIDPCSPPTACEICQKQDCAKRESPFSKYIKWQLDNVMEDIGHAKYPID